MRQLKPLKKMLKKLIPASSPTSIQQLTLGLLVQPETVFVQFGANGVAEDSLQKMAAKSGARCLLVEPHPYYCGILRKRYAEHPNVEVIEYAADETTRKRMLYYIPPDLADQMDGSGPPNHWAHGQGSFDRSQVEYWIRANEFRWKRPDLTASYIAQIAEVAVPCAPASDIILSRCHTNQRCIVIIDTQGAESLVLRGLFARKDIDPVLLTYEDDRGFALGNFLRLWRRGFRCIELGLNVTFLKGGYAN